MQKKRASVKDIAAKLAEAGISLAHDDARQIAMRDAQHQNSHPQAGTSITHLLKKLVSE